MTQVAFVRCFLTDNRIMED